MGANVRWQGIVLIGHHGSTLIAEDCRHRGIQLDWQSQQIGKLFDEIDKRVLRQPGLIRADLSGKITSSRLIVFEVHSLTLTAMSLNARAGYLHKIEKLDH